MNKKTRILVLHSKELIYTGIFIALGIALILLLFFMFLPNQSKAKSSQASSNGYVSGVYSSSVLLNGNTLDVEVSVADNRINSIRLVNLNETVTTMYPLLQPSFDNLTQQIYEKQTTENITYPEENKYTSQLLLDAISQSLEKAIQP